MVDKFKDLVEDFNYEEDDDKVVWTNTHYGRGNPNHPTEDLKNVLAAYRECGSGCYPVNDEDFGFTQDASLTYDEANKITSEKKALETWWNDYMKYVMEDDQYYDEEESHTNFFYRDGKGPKGYETGNYDGPDSL